MEEKLASGHIARKITGADGEYLEKMYYMYSDGAVRLEPEGFVVPATLPKYLPLISNFKMHPTDISIVTYPKSGTTWVQEITWNLVHNPNLDNPQASLSLDAKFPDIEADMLLAISKTPAPDPDSEAMQLFKKYFPEKHYLDGACLHLAMIAPQPRMLKQHMPLSLLPSNYIDASKVIYVARDPRDVVISLYHFMKIHKLYEFTGTLDQFVDDFINDRVMYTPYWTHMKLAWEKRTHPNMCFVFYEDLQQDIFSEVKIIDKFLGTNRSDEQLRNVIEFSSFSSMKERSKHNPPTSNNFQYFNIEVVEKEGGFFRKGKAGDWKNKLSPSQAEKINSWMAKNLPQFGENFKYKV